jgi:hypothetical protein
MDQDKISKLSDDKKNVWDEDTTGPKNVKPVYKPGYGERWNKIRPTKTIFFWSLLATIILTLIVGFNWGGLVTGTTAQKMADDVVAQRLSLICAGQFNQDPQKDQKLTELKDTSSYQRNNYVKSQGWATMPGESAPDNKIADGCVRLIVQSGQ